MFSRGFKSWCENTAISLRSELRLKSTDRLDPRVLGAHLSIVIWNLEDIPDISAACVSVLRGDSDSWSAATICSGNKHAIVLNSCHSLARQNSDLMHELSHILLAHEPARFDVSAEGCLLLSTYDRKQEDEANWLSGCLLVPREALMVARRKGMSVANVATQMGSSVEMAQYRMNVTGVDRQLLNRRKMA